MVLAMKIQVVAIDGVFDTGLSAVLDTLSLANELIPHLDAPVAPFEVDIVGSKARVKTAHGLAVPVSSRESLKRPDVVLVPALGAKQAPLIAETLSRKDVSASGGMLQEFAQDQVLIGAACTATFVLGDAGLLDHHKATTSWWLTPFFRQRFPNVQLDDSNMLVSSPPFLTAGAALAHLDLALGIVRMKSPALASMTARYLLVERRLSQASFVIPDHLAHSDPLVERYDDWARSCLSSGFSLTDAASALHVSERTLSRRLKALTGKSPLAYFQDKRVQQAVHLLETTSQSIEKVAACVGYSDGVTLRTLLRSKLGRGLKDIRLKI